MEAGDMVAARFGRNRAVSAISARIGPVRHKPARISTQQKKKVAWMHTPFGSLKIIDTRNTIIFIT